MKSTAKDDKNVKLRLWIYENVMSLNFVWKFWHQFIESAKITTRVFSGHQARYFHFSMGIGFRVIAGGGLVPVRIELRRPVW